MHTQKNRGTQRCTHAHRSTQANTEDMSTRRCTHARRSTHEHKDKHMIWFITKLCWKQQKYQPHVLNLHLYTRKLRVSVVTVLVYSEHRQRNTAQRTYYVTWQRQINYINIWYNCR